MTSKDIRNQYALIGKWIKEAQNHYCKEDVSDREIVTYLIVKHSGNAGKKRLSKIALQSIKHLDQIVSEKFILLTSKAYNKSKNEVTYADVIAYLAQKELGFYEEVKTPVSSIGEPRDLKKELQSIEGITADQSDKIINWISTLPVQIMELSNIKVSIEEGVIKIEPNKQ